MKTQILLTAVVLLLIGLANAPAASAAIQPPTPLPIVTVGDRDGDGLPEASSEYSTPVCGCNCPVVGGGVELSAAGQRLYVVAATALCQSAYAIDVDPGQPDPTNNPSVEPIIICRGGGFGSGCFNEIILLR